MTQTNKPVKERPGPVQYSEKVANKFLELYAQEEMTIEKICNENKDMPTWQTIYYWRNKHPDFQQKVLAVRANRAHRLVENMDSLTENPKTYIDAQGNERIDTGWVNLMKLRSSIHQFQAKKFNREFYEDPVAQTNETDTDLKKWVEEERERRATENEKDY